MIAVPLKVSSKNLPIKYGTRVAGKSHLQPIADGWKIFYVLLNNWAFSRKADQKS